MTASLVQPHGKSCRRPSSPQRRSSSRFLQASTALSGLKRCGQSRRPDEPGPGARPQLARPHLPRSEPRRPALAAPPSDRPSDRRRRDRARDPDRLGRPRHRRGRPATSTSWPTSASRCSSSSPGSRWWRSTCRGRRSRAGRPAGRSRSPFALAVGVVLEGARPPRRAGGCSASRSRRPRWGRSSRCLSDAGLLRDAARDGHPRHRRRGRVLADRRHLGVPHRRVRGGRGRSSC